ncbi:unnamed protein product, partial [Ectocarpus fasciculatus]
MKSSATISVLEFFSGIGGMRLSLQGALATLPAGRATDLNNVTAFDTSELVNQCYRHCFPGDSPRQVNIESIKLSSLDGAADIWTMSPPCQPFTTTANSKRLDIDDNRNKAFMYLMSSLEKMTNKPEWIFFENVKGFENSTSHVLWTECLVRAGYSWRQYLLSPFQFRIPNGRTRFYMAIHLNEAGEVPLFSQDRAVVYDAIESCDCDGVRSRTANGHIMDCSQLAIPGSINKVHELGDDDITGPEGANAVSSFLEADMDATAEAALTIPDSTLKKKWAEGLSIVGRDDRCTFCFTSAYGQTMHRSTGSLLHKQCPVGKRVTRGPDMSLLHSDQIRFFSPREMLSMFGFPDSYSLPDSMSNRHKYRVIGQSVNVVTVQAMMHSVLCSASWSVENKYLKE